MGQGGNKVKGGKPDPTTHGTMVGQFKVGQLVSYPDSYPAGIAKRSPSRSTGRISKLHRCGRNGSAEIRPSKGGRKIRRRLQLVEVVAEPAMNEGRP